MLEDYANVKFETVEAAQKVFQNLLSEASAIKANADRAVGQRKNDQDSFRTEIDTLKNQLDGLSKAKEELENKGLVNEGNFEELFEKKTEKLRLSYEEKLENTMKELQGSQSNFSKLQNQYHSELINGMIRKEAEKAGAVGIDDILLRANGVFSVSEDGTIEARDRDGNLKKVGNKQLTPEVFVKALQSEVPYLWPQSQGAGAKGSGNNSGNVPNPFDKKGGKFSLTEQAKILNENPELAKELQQAATAA